MEINGDRQIECHQGDLDAVLICIGILYASYFYRLLNNTKYS